MEKFISPSKKFNPQSIDVTKKSRAENMIKAVVSIFNR